MDKLLTIVIPVYNTERYLLRCLNSVVHNNIDVIIVNDGSTDNSPEILNRFAEKSENFKVIHTQNNGAASARITGLKQVKTKYFSFVDSDDFINVEQYFKLVCNMDKNNFKAGSGRMTVFLPSCKIPFNSRKWSKEILDFSKDKLEFNNLTCSLLDKIWHIDSLPLFLFDSKQVIYEDMEIVYYALSQIQFMLHSNDLIYNYCMRGLQNNSTSALGLQMTKSDALRGVLSAASSMQQKFIDSATYPQYKDELDSIIIKLVYQRIYNILINKKIKNKKEMAQLAFQILSSYIPEWTSNKYFLNHFKGSEYNDCLFYIATEILNKVYHVNPNIKNNSDYNELLQDYDKKIIIKK